MVALEENPSKTKVIPNICLEEGCPALKGYFRESVLRMDLERQNKKLREENAYYRKAIGSLLKSIKELLHPHNPAIRFLRERLKDIPEVTQAYYFVFNDVINIWIEIEEEDYEVEMKIINSLRELFYIFSNLLFDFMIVPKGEIPLEKLVPVDRQIILVRG